MSPNTYTDPTTGRKLYRGPAQGYIVYKDGKETLVDDLYDFARQVGVRPGSLNLNLYRKTVNRATGYQVRYYDDQPYNWK